MPDSAHFQPQNNGMTVEERVARVELAEAARQLLAHYARVMDQRDPTALSSIFAADAIVTTASGVRHGFAEVEAFYARHFATVGEVRHFITNTRVTVESATRVVCESYLFYVAAIGGESTVGWGDYRDVLEERPEGLRIVEKSITMPFRGPVVPGWGHLGS
jgi:3-phenylpropionate/cinnamic acid dioxygenase small subunit